MFMVSAERIVFIFATHGISATVPLKSQLQNPNSRLYITRVRVIPHGPCPYPINLIFLSLIRKGRYLLHPIFLLGHPLPGLK